MSFLFFGHLYTTELWVLDKLALYILVLLCHLHKCQGHITPLEREVASSHSDSLQREKVMRNFAGGRFLMTSHCHGYGDDTEVVAHCFP